MEFELNKYKKKLTDEEILSDLKYTAKKLDRDYISISNYKQFGKHSQTAIRNHFGTWRNALSLAGLRTERTSSELKRISDEEYFEDLRRVAEILQSDTVPYNEYIKNSKHCATNIFQRFKKWNTALELAGLCATGFSKDRISEQECLDEIERIWLLLGRQPTSSDIIKGNISKFSIDTYKRRFGSWRKALEAFVKYKNEIDEDVNCHDTLANNRSLDNDCKDSFPKKNINCEIQLQVKNCHGTSLNVNDCLRLEIMKGDHSKWCICVSSPAEDLTVKLHVDATVK